jgi:hypothetical protein
VQLNADNRAAACDVNKVVAIYEEYQTLKSQVRTYKPFYLSSETVLPIK